MARGDKPYLTKSTDRKAQVSPLNWTNAFLICALRSVDFLRKGLSPRATSPQSLFLFPIVFGINLIHFFDGKNKIGLGRIWSIVLGFDHSSRGSCYLKEGEQRGRSNFWQWKVWTHCEFQRHNGELREGRDGKCEGRNEKCDFGKGKCKLIAICAIFWQGKCKFIANFSTMVTSLPSLSLCLSLSHRKYLTHNIGSASALPIIACWWWF